MKDVHIIDDLDQMRALADPLRLRVLEAMSDEEATTKQVAGRIGEKPTKLYHHVEALRDAGLIELVRTKQNRGTLEKYYRPVARRFTVKRELLALANSSAGFSTDLADLITVGLEETAADIRASAEAGAFETAEAIDNITFSRFEITGTPDQIEAALKKLQAYVNETEQIQNKSGAQQYGVTVAFYPIVKKSRRKKTK